MCLLNTFYYFCSSFLNSIKLYERNVQHEDPIQRTNNDLTNGFKLNGGVPFSVFVRPKKPSMEQNTIIQCKCLCDKEASDFPVPVGDWTPAAIVEISPDAISLSDYDVYWGAGESIKQ